MCVCLIGFDNGINEAASRCARRTNTDTVAGVRKRKRELLIDVLVYKLTIPPSLKQPAVINLREIAP